MNGQHSSEAVPAVLPPRVLKFLARVGQARTGSILEVGPLRAAAIHDWQSVGYQPVILTDTAPSTPAPSEQVLIGDVAGGMPVAAHSVETVVVRSARTFDKGLDTPESLLGVANLLSCLKAQRSLLVVGSAGHDFMGWRSLVSGLPVKVTDVSYRDGLSWWLGLQFLKGSPQVQLSALRLEIGQELISRLQWHRLVRELILKRSSHRTAA